MQKILVIAAHPDDECLGLAGTLCKHVLSGDEVYCLILGEGAVMHGISAEDLKEQSIESGLIIGFKKMYFHGFPDNRLDTIPLLDVTRIIERYVKEIKPDIIYTHHGGDLNIDHRITFQAVMTACRPRCSTIKEIYCFETPSSTEWAFDGSFRPNVFIDVSYFIIDKITAFGCYTTEVRDFPHPRSKEGLYSRAQYWGQVAGVEYAEVFELIRKIN
jgi:LmbE family N-acetylglucosaminyl deacetylase